MHYYLYLIDKNKLLRYIYEVEKHNISISKFTVLNQNNVSLVMMSDFNHPPQGDNKMFPILTEMCKKHKVYIKDLNLATKFLDKKLKTASPKVGIFLTKIIRKEGI